MKIAVCPGSFDPVTNGHIDIIRRSSKLFDRVVVLIAENSQKSYSFSVEERVQMLKKTTHHFDNVTVDSFYGLTTDYLKKIGAIALIKGVRAVSDYDYEFQMALANKMLCPQVETLFLAANASDMFLSSSLVKQIAHYGGDFSNLVPKEVFSDIKNRLMNGN